MQANESQKDKKPKSEHVLNEQIPYKKVFVIGADGEKLGVMDRNQAISVAKEEKKDLVLISIADNKPIAKILDYGKFKYEKKKKNKLAKEKQSVTVNREVRLTAMIGDHDLQTKARKSREFLLNGDRVKVSLKFRGREATRPEIGEEVLMKFYQAVEDIAKISKEPTLVNDRFLDMYLERDKKKVKTVDNSKGDSDAKDEN
ncbi:translation initiation factor IF-3 [[Mycoplasma] gypis]|uniref:Translation initiation factor IF-3 n=1 Tax=[Mycoplasma] gypis TaxID=92404 RepID=A0ABZ2RRI6_9BACT|nr:translation initiation factor IF-3 [[Mycoplasma] gypis]